MNATEIGVFAAKTHLSELLERVSMGANFIITKRGTPVAELSPIATPVRVPRYGCDQGSVIISGDFDDPIPEMSEFSL